MGSLILPYRTRKNREYGLTSVADFGMPSGVLKNVLDDYAAFIDFAKLGVGTGYITPNVKEKINLYKQYNVEPYCGGTLFEKAYIQSKVDEYLFFLKNLDIHWVEISTGVIKIPIEERILIVEKIKQDFNVIGEVGSKDVSIEMNANEWELEMKELINAGCQYVIAEGRDSGTAGIYNTDGEVKQELIETMSTNINNNKIIFEAPTPKSQMFFINLLGPNVNLGNVKLHDVLLLEAQRCGLRAETFFLEERKWTLQL
ncbi:phosphosulfolactate synthase [Pueribacillus sp. YX66]|uniref:phosphosulfolactate synthase n=1 Tax=Pueribacillus sp. YX66 TaxID=3229242 RepID=UPI00358D6D9E